MQISFCSKENPKTADQLGSDSKRPGALKNKQTPFKLYADYQKLMGSKSSNFELRTEYTNLSIDNKFKWIDKSAKMYPDVSAQLPYWHRSHS